MKSVYASKGGLCKFLHLFLDIFLFLCIHIGFCFIVFFFWNRSQIKQTLKKKAFEEAGIPVKQISLIQVQSPPTVTPTTSIISSTIVQPDAELQAQITQIDEETVYIKNEPSSQLPHQIITSMPSTSTATLILPAPSEPPSQLIVSNVKEEEEIQIDDTNDELNLLANTDEALLSSLNVPPPPPPPPAVEGTNDSIESNEIQMNEVTSG